MKQIGIFLVVMGVLSLTKYDRLQATRDLSMALDILLFTLGFALTVLGLNVFSSGIRQEVLREVGKAPTTGAADHPGAAPRQTRD